MTKNWVGQSVPRKEDQRLLTGEGQYVSDMVMPFMVEIGFVRSPHAHARIRRIDVSKAKALRGVIDVKTGKDFEHLGPILTDLSVPNLPGATKRPIFGPMPVDEVGYVGDLVAVVAGKDRYVVEDAIRMVEVDYEPLPAVLGARRGFARARRLSTRNGATTSSTDNTTQPAIQRPRSAPPTRGE